MPPIKFGLNPYYGLGGDVVWRISRWPPWQPPWMSEWNEFSSSESPYLPNASDQVSALSDFREQISFQDFQAGHHGGHMWYWNGTNLAILNIHATQMPPTKCGLNPTYRLGADVVWIFSRWPPWRPSWISEQTILAILNLYVAPMSPIKFQFITTYGLGGDVSWRFLRWPTWRPALISKRSDFSNSNSLCDPYAPHQVWDQSDFWFGGRCGFKISKMAAKLPFCISERNNVSNFESVCRSNQCFPLSFCSIWPTVS